MPTIISGDTKDAEHYSVYWICHPDHTDMMSQGYVGISHRVHRRMIEHKSSKQNRHLRFAIDKYGWDNLVKKVVLVASKDYCVDVEKKLRPNDGIGWNLVSGGGLPPVLYGNKSRVGKPGWAKGKHLPEETKKKISEAIKADLARPERKEQNRASFIRRGGAIRPKGSVNSPAHRAAISAGNKGRASPLRGKPRSEEFKQKMKETMQAFKWSCPHCNKSGVSKGAANRWHFDNCKNKGASS
jgi:ribosomal protein L37AE/L43A/predicted GIY-YIG superfamily endonuclease